ncbi:galactose-1-phosphate uridylyltransferase [candidate division KSB1 bacterium]|nr:galactose-1-phosphate uridylyltransferase [bacterium]RKY78322.1 MAG: galactose-1-phosphate uridylyltransferase [candidate division KSB1 bacterium]RKY79107.1 MAG: galactose-1-phosphate uridylyltransferase [candidate division KSB1 bacterium]RKY89661.1 MAG: galactose-1-phosphate uridylyltransferase [candidate division KSB1 bacterium]RKY93118.1 MAG: galactose-1-phosphate uridylyltransferase [candidate division KSB1 bacterium]
MPELRKDPITGRWVIISTERGKRPSDFLIEPEKKKGGFCPFCEGNEDKTPPEIMAYRREGTERDKPGWRIRVVPNKYPALQIEGELNRRGEGVFDMMNGIGAHEVIIETPEHDKSLVDLEVSHIEDVLWVFRDRMIDLKNDIRFRYILIFKNHGSAAGASLEHTHSQLIATPIVPKRVMEELEGYRRYYEYKERCIYCDIVRQELENPKRVVATNDNFIALEPFAPRFPFETWILPRNHVMQYEDSKKEDFNQLARMLKETLSRINRALRNPPYNFIIHTSPIRDDDDMAGFHWHIEIMPKLTKVAGFEWGSGFYINPTPPEDAAKFLCEISP